MNSIYVLAHPITNEIRYVGKTKNVQQRHTSHCYTKSDTHVSRWVQTLRAENLFPKMDVIESGLSEEDWPTREQFWIAYYKSIGARLTNITKGGHDVVARKYDSNELEIKVYGPYGEITRLVHLTVGQKEWIKANERRCKELALTGRVREVMTKRRKRRISDGTELRRAGKPRRNAAA